MWDRRGFLRGLVGLALAAIPRRARAARSERLTARWLHERTRNTRLGALGARLAVADGGEPRKPYPGLPRIALARAPWRETPALGALLRGASGARAPDFPELGRILHLANGVTGVSPNGTKLRAAPSAGALYAAEIYVAASAVEGLAAGLYSYDVLGDTLVRLAEGAPGAARLAALACGAGPIEDATAHVFVANVFRRYTGRYANRGYRYALIDTGHVAENLELAALAAGVGVRRIPLFEDDAVHRWLDLDGEEEAVCAVAAIGPPRAAGSAPPRAWAEAQAVR
ncbi:MAG: hypothetical protein DCC71_07415, partial [Proteobacteria bacterium]